MARLYFYEVDGTAYFPRFEGAATLAVLRSADDGMAHTIVCKCRSDSAFVSLIAVHATIQVNNARVRGFNFTGDCRAYRADGVRFRRFDRTCARVATRAQATRSIRTLTGLNESGAPIVTVEISIINPEVQS